MARQLHEQHVNRRDPCSLCDICRRDGMGGCRHTDYREVYEKGVLVRWEENPCQTGHTLCDTMDALWKEFEDALAKEE